MSSIIKVTDLTREYFIGKIKVPALRSVNLEIPQGQFVAIMGPSGSGKSTLMNILGCLDRPTSGAYLLDGSDVKKKSDNELAEIRNRFIGFIFQTFNLLPRTDALTNVELPLVYRGIGMKERHERAKKALELVGLSQRIHHRPNELSGGEQQRVAIARAIAGDPKVILADEPTGNLDSRSGEEVMAIFQDLHARGITFILVTHDPDIARHAQRIVSLKDGRLVQDQVVEEPLKARDVLKDMPVVENSQVAAGF